MWLVWQYDTDACIIYRFRAHKKNLLNCWLSYCYSFKYGIAFTQASSLLLRSRCWMGLHWHRWHPRRLCSLLPQDRAGESSSVSGADTAPAWAWTDRQVSLPCGTLLGAHRDSWSSTAISLAPTAPQSNLLTVTSSYLLLPSQLYGHTRSNTAEAIIASNHFLVQF